MRGRTSPARRSTGRHVDRDGTDPHGIPAVPPDAGPGPVPPDVDRGPVPPDAGAGPVASDTFRGPAPLDPGIGPAPPEPPHGPAPSDVGGGPGPSHAGPGPRAAGTAPGAPADPIPGPRESDGLPGPRPPAREHDPGRDDRWAPAGVPDRMSDPDGAGPGGFGTATTQAARRWAGPGRATGPAARPAPERPPRDAPPRNPTPRNTTPRNPPPRNPPPPGRDTGAGIPPARRPGDDQAPEGPPDDPYGRQLYGYRDPAPDAVEGIGPGGTRYDEPRYDRRYDEPAYDDPGYDEPGYDERGSGGPAAGVPGEHAGWAGPAGVPEADPGPESPPARRVRRPYGARAGTSRPGYRPAAPAPALDGGIIAPGPPIRLIAIPVAVGVLVAVALGVWARQHEGTGVAVNLAGFSSGGAAKAWLGSLALLLAIVQGVTGRMLHRGGGDPLLRTVHRWTGRAAVLVTVPVAVQCLYAFGWSGATTSALLHSLLGCVFYGAFVTKMLLLRRPGVPGWMLATCGGLLLAVLAGVWLTSALWFFAGHGLSF